MTRTETGAKDRLLESACDVFADKGYRDATVAEICQRAGTNIASVNYYFGDKERLFGAVWRHAFADSAGVYPLDMDAGAADPPEARLRSIIHALLKRIMSPGSTGRFARIAIREMAEPTSALEQIVREVIIPQRRVLIAVVGELLGPGASAAMVHRCAYSVASQCHFLSMAEPVRQMLIKEQAFEEETIEVYVEHITRFSLAGILAARTRLGQRAT